MLLLKVDANWGITDESRWCCKLALLTKVDANWELLIKVSDELCKLMSYFKELIKVVWVMQINVLLMSNY